jgi:hypothetical protein
VVKGWKKSWCEEKKLCNGSLKNGSSNGSSGPKKLEEEKNLSCAKGIFLLSPPLSFLLEKSDGLSILFDVSLSYCHRCKWMFGLDQGSGDDDM